MGLSAFTNIFRLQPFKVDVLCRWDSFNFGMFAEPESSEYFADGYGRSFAGKDNSNSMMSHRRGVYSAIESYLGKYGGETEYTLS